jgi:hypothetical protein
MRRFRVSVNKHACKTCFRIVVYNTITDWDTEHVAVVLTLSIFILKVLGLNLGRYTGYRDWSFL